MISVDKLDVATMEYHSGDSGHSDHSYRCYLTEEILGIQKPLLFAEMEYLASQSRLPAPRQKNGPKRLLVLLVGDSFEPLFQSILAYQPDKLVGIFSNYYGQRPQKDDEPHWTGKEKQKEFYEALEELEKGRKAYPLPCTQGWSLKDCERECHFVQDTEIDVFQKLREKVAGGYNGWEVMVNITGGKKTMVAGAFMFAAYTDASIHYVDFDQYIRGNRRPKGYTCRFRKVENLYDMFQLGAWERVRGFYNAYDFHSALAALPKDPGAPDPGYAPLKTFLQMCSEWSNGRYVEAQNKYDGASLPAEARLTPAAKALVPKVIPVLGELFQEIGEDDIKFLTNPEAVAWYARDAFMHADRLTHPASFQEEGQENEDTDLERRNAFTRAYALHETLINARIALLWNRGMVKSDQKPISKESLKGIFYDFIDKRIAFLQGKGLRSKGVSMDCEGKIPLTSFKYWREKDYIDPMQSVLQEERNSVVHGWHKVSHHQEMMELAESNLQNFLDHWGEWSGLSKETISAVRASENFKHHAWKDLLEACGIQSPIKNLFQKQK